MGRDSAFITAEEALQTEEGERRRQGTDGVFSWLPYIRSLH
jgi:hypothetical protein